MNELHELLRTGAGDGEPSFQPDDIGKLVRQRRRRRRGAAGGAGLAMVIVAVAAGAVWQSGDGAKTSVEVVPASEAAPTSDASQSTAPTPDTAPVDLIRRWAVTSFSGAPDLAEVEAERQQTAGATPVPLVELAFYPNHELGMNIVCNNYGFAWALTGDHLDIGDEGFSTDAKCIGRGGEIEQSVLSFLNLPLRVSSETAGSGNLRLSSGDQFMVLRPLGPVVPPLGSPIGTWSVGPLADLPADGDGPSPAQPASARLLVRADGTVTLAGGCQTHEGIWLLDGGLTLALTPVGAYPCPPDPGREATYQALVDFLSQPLTWSPIGEPGGSVRLSAGQQYLILTPVR
jgi:hypothetical protein